MCALVGYARSYLVACYLAPHAAKPPMRENKIYATRQRRMIALRSKRQCVIAPRVKDARSCCMPKDNARSRRTLLKGGAAIGAVRHGRDARFEPRAADEACTARVNADKF